jgi:predicted RNase H-like HicB family nuclease
MKREFTAVIKQDEGWWIGWVEEIPGVNSQGKTKAELLKNLKSAIKEAVDPGIRRSIGFSPAKSAATWAFLSLSP